MEFLFSRPSNPWLFEAIFYSFGKRVASWKKKLHLTFQTYQFFQINFSLSRFLFTCIHWMEIWCLIPLSPTHRHTHNTSITTQKNQQSLGVFVLDDLDQDQWSKIAQMMVHQRNESTLIKDSSFPLMRPDLSDPDSDNPNEMHPLITLMWNVDISVILSFYSQMTFNPHSSSLPPPKKKKGKENNNKIKVVSS